jgi:hypothetical protein
MAIVARADAILEGPAAGLREVAAPAQKSRRLIPILKRVAWLALTAAVWGICTWLGALLLQALALVVGR